jgi:hypothetical protein
VQWEQTGMTLTCRQYSQLYRQLYRQLRRQLCWPSYKNGFCHNVYACRNSVRMLHAWRRGLYVYSRLSCRNN